jgi:hypothetical protein
VVLTLVHCDGNACVPWSAAGLLPIAIDFPRVFIHACRGGVGVETRCAALPPRSVRPPSCARRSRCCLLRGRRVAAVADGGGFSSTLVNGHRFVLTSSGRDVLVSAQYPHVRTTHDGNATSSSAAVTGVPSSLFPVFRIFGAHDSDVVSVRWFGDTGSASTPGAPVSDALTIADGESCVSVCPVPLLPRRRVPRASSHSHSNSLTCALLCVGVVVVVPLLPSLTPRSLWPVRR